MPEKSKFEIIKAKVEAFCVVDGQYRINDIDTQKEAILIDGPNGALITMSLEKGKVKCSDQAFQQAVMSLEDDTGGYLPVPIQDGEKENIKALVSNASSLGMLSPEGIRNFINPKATGQEIIDHLIIAKELGLSVIAKEIYLIKRKDGTVSHVTGLNAFTRRAAQNPQFSHYKSGVITMKKDCDEPIYRPGTFYPPNETLVGGWCQCFFKDGREAERHSVNLHEYDTGLSLWKDKKATMIEKVTKFQDLRRNNPIECNNMYGAEELGIDPTKEIKIDMEA
jgi:hypothetical protein